MQKENKEIIRMPKESERENTDLKERVKTLEMNIEETEKGNIRNNIIIHKWNRQTRQSEKSK